MFFDGKTEQIKFAAEDVRAALASKGFTVEMQPISSLTASYANRKDQDVLAVFVSRVKA